MTQISNLTRLCLFLFFKFISGFALKPHVDFLFPVVSFPSLDHPLHVLKNPVPGNPAYTQTFQTNIRPFSSPGTNNIELCHLPLVMDDRSFRSGPDWVKARGGWCEVQS